MDMESSRETMRMKTALIIGICILLSGIMHGCITENGQDDNNAPTCTLNVSETSGASPFTITFILGAHDPDDGIAGWSLDIDNDGIRDYFGTGNPSSTQNYTYGDPGIYIARFTVTDTHGDTGTTTILIKVTEPPLVNYSSKVSINPIMSSVSLGQKFCIEILVDSRGVPIRTVGLQLSYTTTFTLKSFAYENLLGTSAIEMGNPPVNDTSGFINYAVSRTDGNADPVNGTLATICFTPPSIPNTYDLFLHDVILIDDSNNIISGIEVTDGIVIIPGS